MFKFISILFISFSWTIAQVHEISGKTVDQKDGSPIAGVNVIITGGEEGAASDIEGNFIRYRRQFYFFYKTTVPIYTIYFTYWL